MIRPTVVREGQPYVDDPIVVKPKRVPYLERAMGAVFGRPEPGPIVVGHERVRLNWLKVKK